MMDKCPYQILEKATATLMKHFVRGIRRDSFRVSIVLKVYRSLTIESGILFREGVP